MTVFLAATCLSCYCLAIASSSLQCPIPRAGTDHRLPCWDVNLLGTIRATLCLPFWLMCDKGRPLLSLLDPIALSLHLATSLTLLWGRVNVRPVRPLLYSPFSPVRVMSEVNIKEQKKERWRWLTEGLGFLLWQRHAHREGKGFVEVNSTLIVYLCSAVQSASIRTVTWLLFALYSSILGLKWQLSFVKVKGFNPYLVPILGIVALFFCTKAPTSRNKFCNSSHHGQFCVINPCWSSWYSHMSRHFVDSDVL